MIDSVFRVLKISVIIAVAAVFALAIQTFLNLITTFIFGGIITEVLTLISMYLPFNAAAVFGSIATALTGILTFLIAKKIFDLTSWSVSSI